MADEPRDVVPLKLKAEDVDLANIQSDITRWAALSSPLNFEVAMINQLKKPDRVLAVARDAANSMKPAEAIRMQQWLANWLATEDSSGSAAGFVDYPIDLYQLIDGRWSFVGEPREAKPFVIDDGLTMLVPVHEQVGDVGCMTWDVWQRESTGHPWRKTGETKEPKAPKAIPVPAEHLPSLTEIAESQRSFQLGDLTHQPAISANPFEKLTGDGCIDCGGPMVIAGVSEHGCFMCNTLTYRQICKACRAVHLNGCKHNTGWYRDGERIDPSTKAAYGVPVGYDIEVGESPQPTAEQEAEAWKAAESLKDKVYGISESRKTADLEPRCTLITFGPNGNPAKIEPLPPLSEERKRELAAMEAIGAAMDELPETSESEPDAPKPVKFREWF